MKKRPHMPRKIRKIAYEWRTPIYTKRGQRFMRRFIHWAKDHDY